MRERKRRGRLVGLALAGGTLLGLSRGQAVPSAPAATPQQSAPAVQAPAALPQAPAALPQAPAALPQAPAATTNAGGTIRGTVKAGNVPLPGVAITATNTLTGKKYATTTDINGAYEMTIPRTGRYVVRAELAAFAPLTSEVRITAEAAQQTAAFTMQLASRAAAAEAASSGSSTAAAIAAALGRGTTALTAAGGGEGLTAAGSGGGNAGAALPSMGALGDAAANGGDSVTIAGQTGSTNALGGISEDEIRERIQSAMAQAQRQGGAAADQMNAVVGMLGGIMGGPGGFGPGGGGPGGGRGGGRGGGFGRIDPTQPHGAIFYQGGFPALQAQASSVAALYALSTGTPFVTSEPALGSQQNRFGVTYTGSPYLPGLTKPSTKQFVFLNVTGNRNITPEDFTGTVPTLAERGQIQAADGTLTNTDANLSGLTQQSATGAYTPPIYNPATGAPFGGNIIPAAQITPQARALLNYYPLPNVAGVNQQNYQTITTAGQDSTTASLRFVRNFGQTPLFSGFGRRDQNGPKTLRQNLNANFSYSHSANDLRNIIPILGGKQAVNGYNLQAGYTIGYGRFTNNASLSWNRSRTLTTNFFTGSAIDPATAAGIGVPSESAGLAQQGFYNGVPTIAVTNFTSLTDRVPQDRVQQTISFTDFVSYSHKKHNMRFGTDLRRIHSDQVGGNNPIGTFNFSGLATESAQQQACTLDPQAANCTALQAQPGTGAALADLLLGQPQETQVQAGLFKTYLRANVIDGYAQDDYRVKPGLTLNYGLRYEYFGPYFEKNNRLVNLDHNADFTVVDPVQAGGTGEFGGRYPRSLVNPDRDMFSPRFGLAYRPKWLEQTVIRAGYGINFNTGQFAAFAQSLAFQPPFAITQNNTIASTTNATGCTFANLTLANGFGCSSKQITNNYAVDKNYRLGHVQAWNVDVQRSFGLGIVVNVGYNGSKGGNLDIVTAPNASYSTVTTPGAQAFTYETSLAESRNQQLVISARERLQKGIALQATYIYGHSIDNASSIGGSTASTVQNSQRLDLEEGNSSFDVRHQVNGNYVIELPFGPNRRFFNQGGFWSKALDGFSVSGTFNFATGSYFTPVYENAAAELAAGGTYTLRPDRVFPSPIAGAKTIGSWFNRTAFTTPANGYGTASRNSIEGPGTISNNMSFSRTVSIGGTRSFEARLNANNVFNTVQYSTIDTTVTSATYGQVIGTAAQRTVTLLARYRF